MIFPNRRDRVYNAAVVGFGCDFKALPATHASSFKRRAKMSNARRYQPHYLVADYQRWEGDWELWFGTAVATSPSPFGPHERAVSEISFQIQSSLKNQVPRCLDRQVYTGLDWIVQPDTVVRPDLMLVCGDQPELHLERSPALIVEVLSESTADKDRTVKRDLYESCGVQHYLIADPLNKTLQWLELGAAGEYIDNSRVAADEKFWLELNDQCVVHFDSKSVFDPR